MTGAGLFAPYNAGFSGALPIPGVTIDPATGEIQFTPTVTGNYVFGFFLQGEIVIVRSTLRYLRR